MSKSGARPRALISRRVLIGMIALNLIIMVLWLLAWLLESKISAFMADSLYPPPLSLFLTASTIPDF